MAFFLVHKKHLCAFQPGQAEMTVTYICVFFCQSYDPHAGLNKVKRVALVFITG